MAVVGLSSVLYDGVFAPAIRGMPPPHLSVTLYTDGRVWLRSLVSQYPNHAQRRGKRDPRVAAPVVSIQVARSSRQRKSSEYDIYTTCDKSGIIPPYLTFTLLYLASLAS